MEGLRSQFSIASQLYGKTRYKDAKTDTGIKDTYQDYFFDRLLGVNSHKGRTKAQKEEELRAVLV